MAIEKLVVPLLAISFSDYEHGQWNSAYIIDRWRMLIFPRTEYEFVLSIFGKIFIFRLLILLYKRRTGLSEIAWNDKSAVSA